LFLIDLAAEGANSSGATPGWDSIDNLEVNQAVMLTDRSGGGDNDVTITALDDGFDPNNPAPPGTPATYDGILVPATARDDYLFKIDDTAGTTARLRIDNLDPGEYNVTVFEGRTTDPSQFATIWVGDTNGSNEPLDQNTGNFAGDHSTVSVTINAGETLWYRHLEDNTGGLSGMIIRTTAIPEPSSLIACGIMVTCGLLRRRARRPGRSV
jgi:hypothetical protein